MNKSSFSKIWPETCLTDGKRSGKADFKEVAPVLRRMRLLVTGWASNSLVEGKEYLGVPEQCPSHGYKLLLTR